MKISIALSLLILGLGSVFGWRDHQRHATVRTSYGQLVAEAAQVGITPDSDPGEDGKRATKREREHANKQVDIGQITADFIAFAKEVDAMKQKGAPPDAAMHDKSLTFMDRMMSLDVAQLKVLIAEVGTDPDLKQETLRELISFSVITHADEHPQTALALFTESSDFLKADNTAKHGISSSLARWAKNDPTAAIEWVRANGKKYPDLVDGDVMRGVIYGAATNNPKLAFKLIGELGIEDGDDAIRNIANTAKTPEERTATLAALREHLANLTDETQRNRASKGALQSLTRNAVKEGFEAGSKWIESAGLTPEEMGEINLQPFNVKTAESGQWVEWIGAKLPREKSNNSIRQIVHKWTEMDYQAAGKWLATTPAGPTKNISIRSYAETVAKYEPESAAQWAMTLPPGQDRDETLKTIYQKWPANDEAAKQAFKKLHGIN